MKTQVDVDWLAHHVPLMRKLKKPSIPQSIILEFAETKEIDAKDRRRLIAAITAEKAAIKATQMQNRLGAVLARDNAENRKIETRRKFILGELLLAEMRTNPRFCEIFLPIIKKHITVARDLIVLAPLMEETSKHLVATEQPPPAVPERAPKRTTRRGHRHETGS